MLLDGGSKERERRNLSWRRALHSHSSTNPVQSKRATMEGSQKAAKGPSAPTMTNKLRNPPGTENIKAGNAGKSALSIISQLFRHEYLMRPGDRAPLQHHGSLSQCRRSSTRRSRKETQNWLCKVHLRHAPHTCSFAKKRKIAASQNSAPKT